MDSGESECPLVLSVYCQRKKLRVSLRWDEGAVTGSRVETLTQQPGRGVCHNFSREMGCCWNNQYSNLPRDNGVKLVSGIKLHIVIISELVG